MQTFDTEELVDGAQLGRFHFQLLLWSFLAMMADGYDISALASAAPQLARSWHLAATAFAPALSASLFGILLGAPLLGWLGDRIGRKRAIVTGCMIYGLATLATAWSANLAQMVLLRGLAGIGLGGLMPNTIALNSELAPRRVRATLIVLMFTGITIGGSIPGHIQAFLIPRHGWQIMFLIGGAAPLLIAAALALVLPESVKFLAAVPHRRAELLAAARRLRRDLDIGDEAHFPAPRLTRSAGSALPELFGPQLAGITALLWVCFACALMANYFLNSWLPLLFESNGLSGSQSGLATSCYYYGGTVGGVLISALLGRFGFAAIAALFLLAVPAIAAIGLCSSFASMAWAASLAGFCTLGAQFGNNAAAGLVYPTAIRSRGVGWAFAAGRLGSIAGPLLGGRLIGLELRPSRLFALAALPMLLGLIAAIGLTRIRGRRF